MSSLLSGGGSVSVPFTIQANGKRVAGVECWVTLDKQGRYAVAGTLVTDSEGFVEFKLDAGKYYLWRKSDIYDFPTPISFEVLDQGLAGLDELDELDDLDDLDLVDQELASEVNSGVIYLRNGGSVSVQLAAFAVSRGEVSLDDLEDQYVIFQEVQSISGRALNDARILDLPGVRSLVSTRWDLFYTTSSPSSFDSFEQPINGPTWDYLPGNGAKIPTPLPSSVVGGTTQLPDFAPDPANPSSARVQYVEGVLEEAGWEILNKDMSPWGFHLPYKPRMNLVDKTIWYNQQQMRLLAEDWQSKITDHVAAFEDYANADGIFFQFVKPQHYGNKGQTFTPNNLAANLVPWAISDGWDPDTNTPDITNGRPYSTFDEVDETAYEWFRGLEEIYWLMMSKKSGVMILDIYYFGIAVWRYARQIIDEWANLEGITTEDAAVAFYAAIDRMGDAASENGGVIWDRNLPVASSDPVYQVPENFGANFNTIERFEWRT